MHYAAPVAVRAVGSSLLVLGNPSYTFATGADGELVTLDTALGGVLVSREGQVRAIARPPAARAFMHPRMVARSKSRTDVVWSEPDYDAGGVYASGPQLLRTGSLVNGEWRELRQLGPFDLDGAISRETGSDLVTVGGISYMAFPDELPVTGSRAIVLLSDSGGQWSTRRLDFEMYVTGTTEFGDDGGTPAILFLGIAKSQLPIVGSRTSTLWLARRESNGWSRATEIAGDGIHPIRRPKLVRSGNSLIAAWLVVDSVMTLEWREVTRGRALGPVNRLVRIGKNTQGQAPFADLLSLITFEGVARIVRLRPDGYDAITEFPVQSAQAPVIAGTLEQPWVLSVEASATPDPGPFRIVARDLRCALRR